MTLEHYSNVSTQEACLGKFQTNRCRTEGEETDNLMLRLEDIVRRCKKLVISKQFVKVSRPKLFADSHSFKILVTPLTIRISRLKNLIFIKTVKLKFLLQEELFSLLWLWGSSCNPGICLNDRCQLFSQLFNKLCMKLKGTPTLQSSCWLSFDSTLDPSIWWSSAGEKTKGNADLRTFHPRE